MLKRFLFLSLLFLAASCRPFQCCSDEYKEAQICPLVNLRNTSFTRVVQHMDSFEITLVGYNGSCFMDGRLGRSRAQVQPIFVIRRLEAGDTKNVPFDFYTETTYGPADYVGKRTYHQIATIPEFQKEIRYVGKTVSVPLPDTMKYNYGIILGLVINPEEQIYNDRTFNAKFDYSEEK